MAQLSDFEDGGVEERALLKYMRGKEMSIEEAMMFSVVSSMLSAAQPKVPTGTIASEWSSDSYAMSNIKRRKMYVDSRKLVQRDGMVFSVLRKFVISTCGSGPLLYVRDSNGDKAGVVRKKTLGEVWLEERIKELFGDFSKLARLVVGQTFINGDLYALHFPIGGVAGTGSHPQLRVILPDFLEKIKFADGWSLTPSSLAYKFRPLEDWISSSEVTPFHVNEELHDGKYGISIPYFVINELPRYLDWLQQRVLKARSDNLAFVIRYLKGAKSLKKRELPSKPMQIDASMDAEKWDTLTLNSGSSRDATSGDGYEFRMRLAAALGLPEHLVTGNAQFAAQMGKDGFPVALFEYYQHSFTTPLVKMAARTLGCEESDLGIAWPQVDLRDRSGRLNEVVQLNKERIISRAEVRRQLRYDSALNDKELSEELQQDMMVAPQQPAGAADFGSLGVGGVGGVGSMPSMPTSTPMPPGASVTLPSGLPLVTKTDHGFVYTANDYLYVPNPAKPSTWKLRIREYVNGKKKVTADQLGRAAAALTTGFMGNKVTGIGAADRVKVIRKLIRLYRSLKKEPPAKLRAAVPPDSFAGRLMQIGGRSKIGLSTDCITDELPELEIVGAGADYGYALGGAIILGGLTKSGDMAFVGEATMMRVDNDGWAKVLDGMRAKYPKLKYVYTGSDEPALTDLLAEKGYVAVAKHMGPDRTRILLEGFQKDHHVLIYYKCRELLSDLFGPQLDQVAGMHLTGGRPDHSDAFRYLAIGLMERIGEIENIGTPTNKEA